MNVVDTNNNCGDVYDKEKLLEMKISIQQSIYRWKNQNQPKQVPQKKQSDAVLDLILNHLTPKEMLSASLVSTNFYEQLGKLDSVNDKIVIKCNSSSLNILTTSERQYSHLEITIRNAKWERASLERVIDRFSPFLKSLKIVKFGGFQNILNKPVPFPNLTELEVHVVGGRLSGAAWSETKSLKKLVVNGVAEDGLIQCLINNSHLEELIIYENSFISYFHKDISLSIQFSLKKLAIFDHFNLTELRLAGEFKAESWNKRMVKNLERFLATQGGTLRSLHLDSCETMHIGKFIVPSIEIIELNMLHGDVADLKVPAVNNVRVFISDDEDVFKIIELMKQFGGLQAVFIKSISIEMLLAMLSQPSYRLKRINYEKTHGRRELSHIDLLCKICIENALGINRTTKENFIKMYCN